MPEARAADVEKLLPEIAGAAKLIQVPEDLEETRKQYYLLSKLLVRWREWSTAEPRPVVVWCSMAKKSWLQPAGEKLFATHGTALRMRGYQKWDSVVYETAVRACVASFVRSSVIDPGYMDHFLKREVKHGFVWTEEMGDFLKTYENNRDKYPTFESFFPEFVTFLGEYSRKAEL